MREIAWASTDRRYYSNFLYGQVLDHWSRRFEYPWIMANGDFQPGQVTLDAGGGDAPLQWHMANQTGVVFNVDLDEKAHERAKQHYPRNNIVRRIGDLENPFVCPLGFFDRVVCSSVLEHTAKPCVVVGSLWPVLSKGGRLLLTFDVASYARWNHTIDMEMAVRIAKVLGFEVPEVPQDALTMTFPEINPGEGEPKEVSLKVLCITLDKE